jgi:hypothetical protein
VNARQAQAGRRGLAVLAAVLVGAAFGLSAFALAVLAVLAVVAAWLTRDFVHLARSGRRGGWTLVALGLTVLVVAAAGFSFGLGALAAPLPVALTVEAARREGVRSVVWWLTALMNAWLTVLFVVIVWILI